MPFPLSPHHYSLPLLLSDGVLQSRGSLAGPMWSDMWIMAPFKEKRKRGPQNIDRLRQCSVESRNHLKCIHRIKKNKWGSLFLSLIKVLIKIDLQMLWSICMQHISVPYMNILSSKCYVPYAHILSFIRGRTSDKIKTNRTESIDYHLHPETLAP